MATLSTLVVNLTANTADYQNQMGKVESITKSTTQKIQSIGKVALGVGAAGFAAMAGGAVLLAKRAIPAASDVVESMNAVNKVFGESSDIIIDWGEDAATQAGLAQSEFFQMSSTTGAMLQNLGIDQRMAAEESVNLAKRAADMASIFNTDVADALGAIQAGLRGEADPLERFGVRLSAAAVKAKAMEMGLLDATGAMDDQARATAALALLYEQTDAFAGDFVETSGDLANAQRVAEAQWENILAILGKMFLPILGRVMKFISQTVLPVVETFAKYLGFVVEEGDHLNDFLADLPVWLQPIAETVGKVVVAFQGFFENLSQGRGIVDSVYQLIFDLAESFGATRSEAYDIAQAFYSWYNRIIEVKDAIVEFMAPIVDWIANTVTWKDVLIALGIAIASVVIPAIVSLLATILPLILIFGAIVLAVALLRKAWETDWGGIRTWLTETWNNIIKPKLEQLKEWLDVNLPIAIETLRSYWEDVLRPALEKFWGWIESSVFPKLQILWEWLEENIPKAIQTLTDFWSNTLYPAIEAIWKFLSDDMMPVWEALGELLEVTVGKAIEALTGLWENVLQPALESIWGWVKDKIIPIFDGMSSSIGGVTGAIETVVGWIDSLKEKIANFELPWWLTPGSPTPFEMGLRGIANAMDMLSTKSLPAFGGQVEMQGVRPMAGVGAGAAFGFGGGGQIVVYGGIHLHDVQDKDTLVEELRELSE
jgi:phage-related protein